MAIKPKKKLGVKQLAPAFYYDKGDLMVMAGSLLHVIVSSLHDLAAITWVGAVLVNSLVVIPTFRRAPEDERVKRQLMMRVQKRMSFLIPPSIVVVVVTGVALARFSPAFHDFFSFVNTYSMILTAKMFLTIL